MVRESPSMYRKRGAYTRDSSAELRTSQSVLAYLNHSHERTTPRVSAPQHVHLQRERLCRTPTHAAVGKAARARGAYENSKWRLPGSASSSSSAECPALKPTSQTTGLNHSETTYNVHARRTHTHQRPAPKPIDQIMRLSKPNWPVAANDLMLLPTGWQTAPNAARPATATRTAQ